ncbi:Uncharacterised protein [Vibrio cholerae]|nr:Uncharacterised protein [Vibrio cholerae]
MNHQALAHDVVNLIIFPKLKTKNPREVWSPEG